MSKNEQIVDYINQHDLLRDDFYTEKTIAWKLLIDDENLEQLKGQLLLFEDKEQGQDSDDDPKSLFHELLLNIFMEMILGLSMIMQSTSDIEPDMTKFNINDFYPIIKDKMTKICIYPSVYESDQDLSGSECRYCKVILRYNSSDKQFFDMNNISEETKHYFIGNRRFKKTDKLEDIFSTCSINGITYKISFSTINVQEKITE